MHSKAWHLFRLLILGCLWMNSVSFSCLTLMRLDALCCTFFEWNFLTQFSCFLWAVVRFSYGPAKKANSNYMHNQTALVPSQHIPHPPPAHFPNHISTSFTSRHHHHFASSHSPPGQKAWSIIRISHKNITVSHKPHTLLQWALGLNLIFRLLQHHLSTIFKSHHHHQPQTPDWTLQSQ